MDLIDELFDRLTKAYEALRAMGRIHKRKDFATLLGANESTISRAFKKDPRYLTRSLVKKAEDAVGERPETKEETPPEQERRGVFIPEETVTLYTNMSESIRILSETISRMSKGGDVYTGNRAPASRVKK